ncbi:toxin-antitoxin system HicB family antitoxin [Clostridium sp. LBM24168]
MTEKTITIRIDDNLHKDIKINIAKKGISLKDYIVGLVKKDLYGEISKK